MAKQETEKADPDMGTVLEQIAEMGRRIDALEAEVGIGERPQGATTCPNCKQTRFYDQEDGPPAKCDRCGAKAPQAVAA